MTLAKRRPRSELNLPAAGQDVVLACLDSALTGVGQPGAGEHQLHWCEAHGKVASITKDPEIHKQFCKPKKRCRCFVVELAMFTAGKHDTDSNLIWIWWETVVGVRVFPE